MKIVSIQKDFLGAKTEGDTTGDWVSEANYVFDIITDGIDNTMCALQVLAKLNMDFYAGGEMEFKCRVVYYLNDFGYKPNLSDLMLIGERVAQDLDKFFIEEDVYQNPSGILWAVPERSMISEQVTKTLKKHYP